MLASGATSTAASSAWWLLLLVSLVPAVAAIISAVIAARAAHRARTAEGEASRLRDLDERNSARKYETYQPMIELLRDALTSAQPGKEPPSNEIVLQRTSEFATWIAIFGSDEAVTAFRNYLQAAYHDAPGPVGLRLYADFVVAARKDIAWPSTAVTALELLGLRINDLHDELQNYEMATLPLEQLAAREGWTVPWLAAPTTQTSESASSSTE